MIQSGSGTEFGSEEVISYLPLSHVAAQLLDLHVPLMLAATVYFAQPDALKVSDVSSSLMMTSNLILFLSPSETPYVLSCGSRHLEVVRCSFPLRLFPHSPRLLTLS